MLIEILDSLHVNCILRVHKYKSLADSFRIRIDQFCIQNICFCAAGTLILNQQAWAPTENFPKRTNQPTLKQSVIFRRAEGANKAFLSFSAKF